MKKINEDIKFKPTLNKPVNDQSKEFEKNFNRTMKTTAPNIKLNEVDGVLSEAEQSFKKKIFNLAKMEALVFSDPKLSAIYDQMSVNGEEKYGYHYNETIMNMIFNDYVLNSLKYLQKYKMAIPKEKKRRDKSGINQLKKAGEERMEQTGLPKQPKKEPEIRENSEPLTKVIFLVNEKDPQNSDLFAYFPEEDFDNKGNKVGYSHIGQHGAVDPKYAEESRPATPEEYADLKSELESIGYNLDVINPANETTGAASSGAYVGPAAWKKGGNLMEEPNKVEETTTSASSGQYSTKYAWGKGDLMKGKESPVMRKPIWQGGTIIQESNYLTDASGFEKFVEQLTHEKIPLDAEIINKTTAFNSDTVKGWNAPDTKYEYDILKTGQPDKPNFNVVKEQTDKKISTPDELKAYVADKKARGEKGLTKQDIPLLSGQALYNVAVNSANRLLPMQMHWNDLPDTNSMWDYIDENGGMSYKDFIAAVKEACNDRLSEEGMSLDDLMESNIDEKAKSQKQQKFMGMVHAIQKGELSPKEVSPKMQKVAKEMKPSDVEDFAKTKYEGLPKKVDEYLMPDALIGNDIVDIQPRSGEKPFIMKDGGKYQFETATYADGRKDIVVYSFSDDVYYDYSKWQKAMGINETDQSMIAKPTSTMANYAQSTSEQGGNVPMGTQQTGGMKESKENKDMTLLEELNKELEAYSIHHQKLMKMVEDRKPSALVLRDRVGAENETNFKKDLSQSDTKQIIDVEKELQWKNQQTDVKDPQKLGQDIEKNEIKSTDANGDEALKNVGDSDNDKGDEIPKRNLTTKEQEEVNMYRLGQHSLVYDNEPSKRFEERMKKDMGDDIYKMRQKQLEFRGKAPMYNKDTQPTDKGIDKVQFDKEKSKWNEREGIKESMITGRYIDALGKRHIIDFTLGEVKICESPEDFFPLDFAGLGNTYNSKTVDNEVIVNESVINVMNLYKFYTDGKNVVAIKNHVQNLTEFEHKEEKPVISEQVNKMKHLFDYKPNDFVNTTNVKKNRGF